MLSRRLDLWVKNIFFFFSSTRFQGLSGRITNSHALLQHISLYISPPGRSISSIKCNLLDADEQKKEKNRTFAHLIIFYGWKFFTFHIHPFVQISIHFHFQQQKFDLWQVHVLITQFSLHCVFISTLFFIPSCCFLIPALSSPRLLSSSNWIEFACWTSMFEFGEGN